MTDPLNDLRPPRRHVPDGGDLRAIAGGRRAIHRRRATYGALCGAGALAAGSIVALGGNSSRDDSVRFLDQDPSATPSPSPTSSEPTPLMIPSAAPTTTALPTVVPSGIGVPPPIGGSAGPEPTGSPSPEPPAGPEGPYVGPEPTTADGGAVMTRTASSDPSFCSTGAQQQASIYSDGWCSAVSGPADVVAGRRVSYSYKLCRNVSSGDGQLHFDTAKEVEVTAQRNTSSGTEPVWHAGTTAPLPPHPHTVSVAAGDCLTWTTTWSGQNDNGYAVPQEDSYIINAYGFATEWVGEDADAAAPVAFTPVSVRWE